MNYKEWAESIEILAGTTTNNTDSNLIAMFPRVIEYGELRIYREIDFLATLASQTATLTASSRNVALPTNVIVLQSANVITPSSVTNPDLGTRRPLQRVSLDFINAVWPSATPPTTPSVPTWYAEIGLPAIGSTTTAGPIQIVVGPAPDATYTLECIGTVRPSPLSPSNPTTLITTYMPDLFVAACMIFVTGYQRDFGAQTDDPKSSLSWEQQYNTLKAGVDIEEMRKKAQSAEWSAYQPSPVANAPRDRASGVQ